MEKASAAEAKWDWLLKSVTGALIVAAIGALFYLARG
jgi:hypothetical protein